MNTYIVLLRGINVGGNNKLPMRELVAILEGLGLQKVKTYIQSGNAVFQSEREDRPTLAAEIGAAIEKGHGFNPQIFILDVETLQKAVAGNPFPKAEDEPKTLHFFFLAGDTGRLDYEALDKLKTESEHYRLLDNVLYFYAPEGISRSKLGAALSKGWKELSVTARNLRSASKILDLALALEQEENG